MENEAKDVDYEQINQMYDECLNYLKDNKNYIKDTRISKSMDEPDYETIKDKVEDKNMDKNEEIQKTTVFKLENEKSNESLDSIISEPRSERLRKLSKQLPKIIITQSTTSLDFKKDEVKSKSIRNDRSKSDRNLPKIDPYEPRNERSMPQINQNMPKMNHKITTVDRNVLKTDRSMTKNEISMSTMDRRMPKVMKPFNHVATAKKPVAPSK